MHFTEVVFGSLHLLAFNRAVVLVLIFWTSVRTVVVTFQQAPQSLVSCSTEESQVVRFSPRGVSVSSLRVWLRSPASMLGSKLLTQPCRTITRRNTCIKSWWSGIWVWGKPASSSATCTRTSHRTTARRSAWISRSKFSTSTRRPSDYNSGTSPVIILFFYCLYFWA